MIQRIQTVYLGIAIILLAIVTVGTNLFTFVIEDGDQFVYSAYGISRLSEDGSFISQQHFPVYIGTIALVLLMFLCLMSYKNLQRQFKLGRSVFYLYFLSLVTVLVLSFFGDQLIDLKEGQEVTRQLGLGFYLFVAGFPFTFLANTGIKRDKNLLDSLDRLR